MKFHLIVTCVSQKKAKKVHSILDPNIKTGSTEDVYEQWLNLIQNSNLKSQKAYDLYKGSLWNSYLDAWGIIRNREKNCSLWVLSAGYGLINSKDNIIPYDITFQEPRNNVPSILSKIKITNGQPDAKRKTLQEWWRLINSSPKKFPKSIKSLISSSGPDEYFLFVLGKDYLDAVYSDLKEGIATSVAPENIAIVSNNVDDPLAKTLIPNWLYSDSRFVNLPKTNNTLVNAKIAHNLLCQLIEEKGHLNWLSVENLNDLLKQISRPLPKVNKPARRSSTDEQVLNFINNALRYENDSFSKLHRAYRDSGWACEYSRFKKLYHKTKNDLKNIALEKRPYFPVKYQKRNTKMMFFLPDWDDRVDPLYDFQKDEVTPNRDPYYHDVYHYEIYGYLNCDGILVSKTVLEANKTKKKLAERLGIHKYLRLPNNVPVLGDCGAFNYIGEFEPPFKTSEILSYYQNFDFNYGVSIDHLIVPGILKKHRFFVIHGNSSPIEISNNGYKMLREKPNTIEVKSKNAVKQLNIISDQTILFKETYFDEEERERRYQLTIKNSIDFIEGHKAGGYTFCPIGAVQGWSPESYAHSVKLCQEVGYSYLALGGLARSSSKEIIEILEAVNKVRRPSTKLHLFGVARLDAVPDFLNLGLSSVDSAAMLRQAWLSSANNYYSSNTDNYAAIRIPTADNGAKAKKVLEDGSVSQETLFKMETKCLKLLRLYDNDQVSLDEVLNAIMQYHMFFNDNDKIYDEYRRTLTDQPWKECPCQLCKDSGIDIVIFRRNNRNRRRGFHNTWVFFNELKKMTEQK